MDSSESDYTGMEPTSISNRCEDIDEKRERKTVYLMSREQKDILANMKEEEEDGERQSVKMEKEDGVRDEEELWKEEEETDEQMEGHATDLVAQTDKLLKNGIKSEHAQREGEELSTLVTSCLLKKPRVLIRRLEISNSSLPVSPPHLVACQRGQGERSPWRQHELSPLRGNRSLTQKKGQVVTWKRNTIGQLQRPLKMRPSSSENGICAEASLISPVISPRNQNTGSDHTGQTVEVSCQVFACSQCPFVHTEEVNLHQHIEKVHPEELNTTVRSQQSPSSTHQHPTPPKTLPTLTQPTHTGERWFYTIPITCTLMETMSFAEREIGDPLLPVSSLHLLVPPLKLLSAAMWQVLQQQDMLHYGKLEEFVSLVTDAFPELLSESQRTELTLGLQQFGCKTDPALEVLLWEFLSTLDQLLPTVSWLSAAPSVLEVCLQSVYYPDQLKTLLRHHRSLGQLDMNATLPFVEEYKLSSMSRPPCQRVVDSTKLTNANSQSESITNCMNCLRPASSGEAIQAESVMDSSDYTGMEPASISNRCEDIDEKRERKTGYLMSREQKDVLANMKREEEDGERQSVKMEREDGVRDEEELWKEEEETDEQMEGHATDLVSQTDKLLKNGMKTEHAQQEGEELSTLVTSCLLKNPRVLIRRLDISNISLPVSSPHLVACQRGQGARSPWKQHELFSLRGNGSLTHKKGQGVTRKRNTIVQLEKPLKMLPSSSENGMCAEASLISPVISPRNQNTGSDHTGQTVELSSQVFACSHCSFFHTEEVNLHQHIEKVHPEELNTTSFPGWVLHNCFTTVSILCTLIETISFADREIGATLPFIEEYMLSSLSHPLSKSSGFYKADRHQQPIRIHNRLHELLKTRSSGENIQAESLMDSSDYTGMEPTSISNRCEDIDEKTEMKTVYLMSREQKDLLTNMKEEEEDGERQSVKMEKVDGVRDEEELWKEEEETDEQMEGHATDLVYQTDKLLKNGIKSEHAQREGEELSTLVTSCLLKKPRVLIRRLEISNSSLPVSPPPHFVACQRGQGDRSPWGQHELSPLTQKKGQVVTWKRNTIGQLQRPLKMLPSSSENGICAEASLISPVISPSNQNTGSDHTGQTVEVSSRVFVCSHCPFVHTEEVNLHRHIEKVHPEELNMTTVSWLSAAPSVLEVCLQSVYYPDQLTTLLRHHRTTLLFIEYKLPSLSKSGGFYKADQHCLSSTTSGEDIQAESVMDSSNYTGMETSISNRCEDIDEKTERKTVYLMSREQRDLLANMKEEQEDGERQSVKMEKVDGVRDDEELWKEEEETDEQMEGHATDLVAQTDKLLKNGIKSEHAQQEGEELSTLVTFCLLKKPRVLIRRLEIANSSLPVSSSPHLVACQRGQGARSPWGQHELLPVKVNVSLTQKKGQIVTRKRNTIGQLERPPKILPSSSENRICAESSLISPVISPRNQNTGSDLTGQSVEVSSQVFACSQCPFVHTEEVSLHQHIEEVHPEERNTTVRSQQSPSSTHQHPTPRKTLPTPTQYPSGTPGTVSWLSAAPSVLEVCLQSVYYPDQLKTLLRYHRSLGQLDMNATHPFIEEYKLSSMSRPPCQRVVDSTKLTNTHSQSESITDFMNCLRPASSGEDIQAESVMDTSDYRGMEPTSISKRCEDVEEMRERKTGYLMSREQKDILANMKKEDDDGERQSVKMEREDGVRDEEELWKEEEETDEQMEGHATDLVSQTDKLLKNGIKSEHAQREGEELSTLVTSCLLKKPRVLICRLEIANSSLSVSSPPHRVTCQRGQGERSPWGQHELLPLRGNGSLTHKKRQVVTRKRNTTGQLERPPKMLPSSSENRICAEASLISSVISPRNQNTWSDHTGQTVEVSSQVFACSQCPFVHTEEVNLHQHIEKVHPEELNTTVMSAQIQAEHETLQESQFIGHVTSDITVTKELVLLTRLVTSDVEVRTRFAGLIPLQDGTTSTITDTLQDWLHKMEIPIKKVMGFGTDGSAVMTGPADCERAFSVLERVKARPRSWMKDATVNALLTISIEGPQMDAFNFDLLPGASWGTDCLLAQCCPLCPGGLSAVCLLPRPADDPSQAPQKSWIVGYECNTSLHRVQASLYVPPSLSKSGGFYKADQHQHCLRPTTSGEDIQAESVMDSSNYTGMETTSISNKCEDREERRERKTRYLMSREQRDLLANMKEEQEDGERQSVKMEKVDDEELWKEETDEQMEGHATDLVAQTDKLLKNGIKSEHAQREGEELSTLVTFCLLKKPRVLIHRLEIANSSLPVSSSPHLVACQRGQGARSPWGQHELLPVKENVSLTQKKGQIVTRKRNTIGQLERPPKILPSSSENRICAESSLISPVISPRNQNTGSDHTGQSVEVSSQVFACSQCPFVHTEEVNLHQHIEEVHPEELNTTVRSQQSPSSTHQHPTPRKTLPTPTQYPSGTPGTVSWLSAAPSVLEVCLQSVYYPDQLKTLLRHHRSLGQLDMNATHPFIEEYKLSSMSCPPCQRVVDSTKLTNTHSQSESITDFMNCLRPASSGEDIQAESVMDISDYRGMEPTSISKRCEDVEEMRERKTGYLMSREQKDILANMKKEDDDGERQSVKMEREDGVRDEEELWKEEEETDEQMEGHATDLVSQTDKLLKNGIKSEHAQREGEELSTLVTSCLLKKPRVLIRRLEIANSSLHVSSPHLVACQRGQGARSPWGHELSPLRGNGSLTQKKGQVVTRKRNTIGQLERPPKMLPSSSENG
ncbi:hypothetical protein SKAU_G00183690 [Synaphobranchus kaupii]|uniref:C2H2-type domain-containing protein n=1 Tax=Synaphobranchus kaupii TaxID=118154 RepID=A0A9Q1FC30_SYNKA|nr:hypothetical protein SKAU_G00183690 [Synaphobranchus kaupii]